MINRILCKLYHTNIINHFENPRNVGKLDESLKNVGTALIGAPACGDVMKLSIQVDENNIIKDVKFKTFGCGTAIASSSYVTEYIKGKHIDNAYMISNKDIANELKLPPVKLHCSLLAENAVQTAIDDLVNKNTKNGLNFH